MARMDKNASSGTVGANRTFSSSCSGAGSHCFQGGEDLWREFYTRMVLFENENAWTEALGRLYFPGRVEMNHKSTKAQKKQNKARTE